MSLVRRVIPMLLIAIAFGVSAVAYPNLPPRVPTHWGLDGQANGWSGPVMASLLMPCIMTAVWIFLVFAPRHDGALFIRYDNRQSDATTSRPVYGVIITMVLALMLAIHVFSLGSALGWVAPYRAPGFMAVVLSVFAIAVGNYMPRVTERNAFIGFRVPWAYASAEVWRRTQRVGGYAMVAAGVVGLVAAAVAPGLALRLVLAALVVQVIAVSIYSYRLAHSSRIP